MRSWSAFGLLLLNLVLGAACHREPAKQGAPGSVTKRALPDAGVVLSPKPPGLTWNTPPDWRREAFLLPPSFAPELPAGSEELRFAPGFSTPGSPGFWSYAFAWWLPESVVVDGSTLTPMLEHYFRGLCAQMGGTRFTLTPGHFRAELVRVSEPATDVARSAEALRGTVESYECQDSGQPMTLRVRLHLVDCPQSARRAVVVLASPASEGVPIWHELKQRFGELSCL